MPLVHYIWWGNPATDKLVLDATRTPNQLAKLGRVSVHYWRNSADAMIGAQPARGLDYVLEPTGSWPESAALDARIIVHDVKSTGDRTTERDGLTAADILTSSVCHNELPSTIHEIDSNRGELINAIVATLSAYNMRSAVKDLLCLMVLFRCGGWYFDTTTAITETTPGDIVTKLRTVSRRYSDQLAAEDEVRFVKSRIKRKLTLKLDDRSDEYTMMLGNLPSNLPGVVELDDIDTWGMFAPPCHPAILTMIDSYVERAQKMGLDRYGLCDTGPSPKTAEQQRNHRYLVQDISSITQGATDAEKLELVRAERNRIIGNINIASVQEGLAKYRPTSGRSLTETTFATRSAPAAEAAAHPRVHVVVNEFGIGKRHAGNWRNV
jgi:hypothetical protein